MVNMFITKLDDQTEQVSSLWKGLWETFTNLRKGLKVSRWNSVNTNAKGYKFDNGIIHTNTAGQAADLHITVGKKLNINGWLCFAAKMTSTSPEVKTGIHFASCIKLCLCSAQWRLGHSFKKHEH